MEPTPEQREAFWERHRDKSTDELRELLALRVSRAWKKFEIEQEISRRGAAVEDAHRLVEVDQAALGVGAREDANVLQRWGNWIAVAAIITAVAAAFIWG